MGIIAVTVSSLLFHPEEDSPYHPRDYEEILKSGELHAVTEYNSISFHASGKDSIAGFHYELLKAFTEDKGLNLQITPLMSMKERKQEIIKGKYDLLANDVLITHDSSDDIAFTHPILLSKQILIQRKAQNQNDSLYIKSQLDLANKTLHIVQGSPYRHRIENLSNEIGDTIYIKEIEKYGPEQIISMVAYGDIDYAVCDENIAQSLIKDFPQLDISTPISFTQFYAWGVNKQCTELLDTLNAWLEDYKQTQAFKKLKQKYYKENSTRKRNDAIR